MAGEFWLSQARFGRLAPWLPTDTRRGVAWVDDCRVISRIVHVVLSGGLMPFLLRSEEDALQPLGQMGTQKGVAVRL